MLKAIVIGMGPHGRRVASVLAKRDDVRLLAVVDRRAEALDGLDLAAGTARLRDTASLWTELAPEVVCIATNGPSHRALALEALEHGASHLMVEKPMACSAAECDVIIAAAESRGARLVVNQGRRHEPIYRFMRERIRSGHWGKLRAIWIQRPGIGLGCLGTHSFDLASFLVGSQPERVTAWVDEPIGKNPRGADFVDPGGLVVLEYAAGVRATVAQIEDGAGPMSLEVHLTGARIRYDEKQERVEILERDLGVAPGPNRPPVFRAAEVPADVLKKPDLPRQIAGLFDELLGTGPLECDARSGLGAVEVLAAAHLSSRANHTPVLLPLREAGQRELWLPVT